MISQSLSGSVEPAGFHRTLVAEGPALWTLLEALPAHGRIADYIAELLDAARHIVSPRQNGARDDLVCIR